MWQWLNKAFSAGKALEFAGSLLKDGAQQQMTGWLGLSLTDEAIMSQLMDCLTGDTRKAVEAFLIHIGDQKNRFRQVLGKIQIPSSKTTKKWVVILDPDGKPVLDKDKNPILKEEITADPSVAFNDQDPRVCLLKKLGECILDKGTQENGFREGFPDAESMLLVTGAILEKSHWKRVWEIYEKGKEHGVRLFFEVYGVKDHSALIQMLSEKADEQEKRLARKRKLGFLGRWILGCALIFIVWLVWILITAKP